LNSGSGVTGLGTVGVTTLSSTTANATTANLTNANIGRVQTTSTAVNAAGSAIGNATALSYGVNIVGAADNSKGVILPVAVTDGEVEVISIVNAKSLLVYPQVNSAIAGLAANAAFTIGPANTGGAANAQLNYAKFKATNTTQWYGHG
jgi:sugar (pentulose or hexulose) kinase